MPGSRRGILLQETQSLDESRLDGARGCVQLLPGKKPRSVRRGWGSDHKRSRSCRQNQDATRSRPERRSTTTTWKAITDGRTAIQAGLLHAKLAHLANWNTQRRDRATEYNRLLAKNAALTLPYEPSWSHAVYHLYVIRTYDRDGMMNHLKKAAIGTGIHYPIPLHLQKAYASLNYSPGDFPSCGRVAAEIVSLPMFPHLTADQQARVAAEILAFTSKVRSKRADEEESLFVAAQQTA